MTRGVIKSRSGMIRDETSWTGYYLWEGAYISGDYLRFDGSEIGLEENLTLESYVV